MPKLVEKTPKKSLAADATEPDCRPLNATCPKPRRIYFNYKTRKEKSTYVMIKPQKNNQLEPHNEGKSSISIDRITVLNKVVGRNSYAMLELQYKKECWYEEPTVWEVLHLKRQ